MIFCYLKNERENITPDQLKANILGRSPGMSRLERLGNVPVQRKRAGVSVQATVTLNDESEEREINGVRAAMKALRRKTGWIVTLADEDEMSFEEGNVMIVPFHKFKPEAVLTP